MNKVILYRNIMPLRILFTFEIVVGSFLLTAFVYMFFNEIYLDIWTFAGPLFGLAIFITGLTGSKIKEIYLCPSSKQVEIIRESLFKTKHINVNPFEMTIELKTANGKKGGFIPKIRLSILDSNVEVEKLESGFLSINNGTIEKLYDDLKSLLYATRTIVN